MHCLISFNKPGRYWTLRSTAQLAKMVVTTTDWAILDLNQ
jgi:hypothetical protein